MPKREICIDGNDCFEWVECSDAEAQGEIDGWLCEKWKKYALACPVCGQPIEFLRDGRIDELGYVRLSTNIIGGKRILSNQLVSQIYYACDACLERNPYLLERAIHV